jgi:hypothetical protein
MDYREINGLLLIHLFYFTLIFLLFLDLAKLNSFFVFVFLQNSSQVE